MRVSIPLSEQEEAHVALIMQLHDAQVQQAMRVQQERLGPLYRSHNIPPGTNVDITAQVNGLPAMLSFEGPDMVPPVPDSIGQVGEKSTSADAPES